MIETYAMDEHGDLVVTWEAETPEEEAAHPQAVTP